MKKKFAVLLALCMLSTTTTFAGCAAKTGDKSNGEAETVAISDTTVSDVVETVDVDEGATFSLLDVTADKVSCSLYAQKEDGTEVVYTMFDVADKSMVALFELSADGTAGDVYCGSYETREDFVEDGTPITYVMLHDEYTGTSKEIGYANAEDNVIIYDGEVVYKASVIEAEQVIPYMSIAAALVTDSTDTAFDDTEISPDTPMDTVVFDILSVTPEMVTSGFYAIDSVYNETVLGLFTAENGDEMAALVKIATDGTGSLVCGTYTSESDVDDDALIWTKLTITDIYTGETVICSYREAEDGACYILSDSAESVPAEVIDAATTVNHMGVGLSFIAE